MSVLVPSLNATEAVLSFSIVVSFSVIQVAHCSQLMIHHIIL
jgi:hypothetical protein